MAENPIVQTNYTADPAPMVYNDTFWVYSGHDEDAAQVWFNMQEWRCWWKFTPAPVATNFGNATTTVSLNGNAIKIAPRSTSSMTLQINGFAVMGPIAVQLFDLSGKLVATLFEGELGVNGKSILFDAKRIPSGSYLVRVAKSGSSLLSKKIQIN